MCSVKEPSWTVLQYQWYWRYAINLTEDQLEHSSFFFQRCNVSLFAFISFWDERKTNPAALAMPFVTGSWRCQGRGEGQALDVLPGANKIEQDKSPPGTHQQNGLRWYRNEKYRWWFFEKKPQTTLCNQNSWSLVEVASLRSPLRWRSFHPTSTPRLTTPCNQGNRNSPGA